MKQLYNKIKQIKIYNKTRKKMKILFEFEFCGIISRLNVNLYLHSSFKKS